MYLCPTRQWVAAYGRALDASPVLSDMATTQDQRSEDCVRLVVADLPLAETSLGDLPPQVLADVPPRIEASVADVPLADAPARLDGTVRPALPATVQDLLAQIETPVHDGAIHTRVAFGPRGVDVTVLSDTDDRDAETVVRGPLRAWQRVVDGQPIVSAVLRGSLTVDGLGLPCIRNTSRLQELGHVAAAVDTTHLFEPSPRTVGGRLVDTAVRQPVTLDRHLRRQASLVAQPVPFP